MTKLTRTVGLTLGVLAALVAMSGCVAGPPGDSGGVAFAEADPDSGDPVAEDPERLIREAMSAKSDGHLEAAENLLRAALEIDPDCARAHRILGWILARLGQRAEAIEHFRTHLASGEGSARRRLEVCAAVQRLSRYRPRPIVAIAFDDFPFPGESERLLKLLNEAGVRATFFAIGGKVEAHPEIVRAAAEAGHSIQNHTQTHPRHVRLSRAEIADQCRQCSTAIEVATHNSPCVVRWPGAHWSRQVELGAADAGLVAIDPIITSMCDVGRDADRVIERLGREAGRGRILAFHDGCGATRHAMPEVVAHLQAYDAEFVTVPELLGLERPATGADGRPEDDALQGSSEPKEEQADATF